MNRRTLCYRCKEAYIDAGYKVVRTEHMIKEPCDICARSGWEYAIGEKRNDNEQQLDTNAKNAKSR